MERCPYCFKPIPENGRCDCDCDNSSIARIEEALQPGTVVGACYQIGAVLARGGFGITYRGFDLNMERRVAIKEFFPSGMVTRGKLVARTGRESSKVFALTETDQRIYQKSLELFYREAKALGKLDRLPNVVHAYHIFRENGTAYIVMDFIEGEPLSDRIRKNGRIPEQELIPLLDPILIVLDKVHEMGILHRDIAPDNIMIRDGQPILLDFGAARVEENRGSSLLIGKKGYSSPEQLAGGSMDSRSDIYSMGASYYTALSGTIPQDSIMRTIDDQVVPLKQLVPEISQNVSDAVMKAMALKPDDRWNNAAEFRKALNGIGNSREEDHSNQTWIWTNKSGGEEGRSRAQNSYRQISENNASETLGKEFGQINTGSQVRSLQAEKKQANRGASAAPDDKLSPKRVWPLFLAAATVLGLAVFFFLQPGKDLRKGQTSISAQEMTLTALAAYSESSTAEIIQTETQQVIDSKLTAIARDRTAGTAYAYETETKQAKPTDTPIPPTDIPIPTATGTPKPTVTNTPKPTFTNTPDAVLLNVGDVITYGSYEQDDNAGPDPIEWQILAVEDGRALVISKYGLAAKKYNETKANVSWETCSLRTWLNGTFYNSVFTSTEKTKIRDVVNSNHNNPNYVTNAGRDTQDKIFLLSISEVEKYMADNSLRRCIATDQAKKNGAHVNNRNGYSQWWLRSPGNFRNIAANVDEIASISYIGKYVNYDGLVVRPAFWLDLT